MSTISLRLPDSLHARVRRLAKKDHISINQFTATALAEKISALETEDFLGQKGKRGSRRKFQKALSHVPDAKADDFDRIF